MIVISISAPWTGRNIPHFDKLPVGHIGRAEAEIFAHGRRDIETSDMIQIRLWAFILENMLEMVGPARSALLQLGITPQVDVSDCEQVRLVSGMNSLGGRSW